MQRRVQAQDRAWVGVLPGARPVRMSRLALTAPPCPCLDPRCRGLSDPQSGSPARGFCSARPRQWCIASTRSHPVWSGGTDTTKNPRLRNRRSAYELHTLRVGNLDSVDHRLAGDPETHDLAASYPLRLVFSGFERLLPTLTPSVNGKGPDCRVSDRDQKPACRDEQPTHPSLPPLRYAHPCPANQRQGSGDCHPRVGQGTLNLLPRRKPSGVSEYRNDACDQRGGTKENRKGADAGAGSFLGHDQYRVDSSSIRRVGAVPPIAR